MIFFALLNVAPSKSIADSNFDKSNSLATLYIFFNGSYLYKPNKEAIDLLMDYILPKLINYIPNIKLVICGGGINRKINKKTTINLNIVTKNDLATIIKKSRCLVVPLTQGFGTRIKILEDGVGLNESYNRTVYTIGTSLDGINDETIVKGLSSSLWTQEVSASYSLMQTSSSLGL